jgi:hypothetical protein
MTKEFRLPREGQLHTAVISRLLHRDLMVTQKHPASHGYSPE